MSENNIILAKSASNNFKDLLIVDSFKFRKVYESKCGNVTWRCTMKSCLARLIKNGNSTVSSNFVHNHNADEKKLNRQLIRSVCKKRAKDMTDRPIKIIRSEITKNSFDTLDYGDVKLIRDRMYPCRNIQKNIPKNVVEVQEFLQAENIISSKGESMVAVNDIENNIVIFTCTTNLQFLSLVKTIYVDGTFTYCTKFFCQLFTIHGFYNNHYIPLIFCLLPSKCGEVYEYVFRNIKRLCSNLNLEFSPVEMYSDFEKSILNSASKIWPEIKLSTCRFHLGQCWYRKIQNLGLTNVYKTDTLDGKWLQYCFGLPFLYPLEVSDCFLDLMSEIPGEKKIQLFADYLVDNFISEDSVFPPQLWAKGCNNQTQTTNACESFHKHFNSYFFNSHPSINKFVEVLKEFQTDTYLKINIARTTIKKTKNNAVVKKHWEIQNLRNASTSPIQFIKTVCNKVKITKRV